MYVTFNFELIVSNLQGCVPGDIIRAICVILFILFIRYKTRIE